MKIRATAAAALTALFLALTPTQAHMVPPWPIPSERIIRNLDAYLKQHPKDPDALYDLGRVYYAAFIAEKDTVPTYGLPYDGDHAVSPQNVTKIGVYLDPHDFRAFDSKKVAEKSESIRREKAAYLRHALDDLKQAVALKPEEAIFHLTLASAYEDGLALAVPVESLGGTGTAMSAATAPDKARIEAHWKAEAAKEFLRAFDLNFDTERKEKEMTPYFGGPDLGEESGKGYLRVAATDANPADTDRVTKGLKELGAKIRGITPVVFSMRPNSLLRKAVAGTRTTSFDLDGTGRPQRYSWVRPDTGILIWDPDHTGRITSGRQLFGSVTWWVFWRDGYRALDALDDNRDGRLSGAELNGIGVWFDRNGDGISEPGEVVSAQALGIASIACRATGKEDGMLASRAGIVMRDGTRYTSWDWVAKPATGRASGMTSAAK